MILSNSVKFTPAAIAVFVAVLCGIEVLFIAIAIILWIVVGVHVGRQESEFIVLQTS